MNIIITGASRGIGFDTTLSLIKQGHQVLALSRNETGLKKLQAQAEILQVDACKYLIFDLSSPDQEAFEKTLASWEKVDGLINNAGLLINKPFLELEDADWQQLFEVNFFGVVRLIRMVLPYLKQSPRSHILNISSMGGFQGSSKFPGLSAYSASKAALSNLTECLAEELKEFNIASNCLALGAVATDMLQEAFPGLKAPVTSQDMGDFVAYFATQGHQFFNGKVLPVSVSTP